MDATSASLMAGIGLALMYALPGAGSAISLVAAGNAVIGAVRKKPEVFGQGLVLSALPASHGLFGFVVYFLYASRVTPDISVFNAAIVLGAGLTMGIAGFAAGAKQGQVVASGINAMGNGHNVLGTTLILAAFPELFSILGLVVAFLMQSLMK